MGALSINSRKSPLLPIGQGYDCRARGALRNDLHPNAGPVGHRSPAFPGEYRGLQQPASKS